ncbi:MAG TPA: helix-turn-helix domain-containing protein [Gemmatimonadaceae bacterium]|nr:helix-turn-helix domain-containing protein [Gemmatimonadaceae bacterium]
MAIAVALLPDPVRLGRLRTALRSRYSVVACADWTELLRTCARERATLAVLDLRPGPPANAVFDGLRQLKRLHPTMTRVLYVALPPARPQDLFEAGRFGVEGVVVADENDDPASVQTIIERAAARGVADAVRTLLEGVRPTARDAMLVAVTRAHQRLTPEQLARVLGIRRRALAARLEAAGFPPPQQLITWGRLIVAAQMLEDGARSADAVARTLDFPSGSAFRNTCRRYVGLAPLEIGRGGATTVIAALAAELAARTGRPPSATAAETPDAERERETAA